MCIRDRYDAKRSVKKIKDTEKAKAHLEKIAIEAAKQCGRSRIPTVEIIGNTEDVAARINRHDCVLFAYEEERGMKLSDAIPVNACDIGIIIGPEGGFEKEEAENLISAGASVCSLGKLILRAETASIRCV